jgi:hypothetical protein
MVEADTTALVLAGPIEESMQVLGSNAQGWPVRRYTYQVTEEGRKALAEVAEESREDVSTVTSWIDQIENFVGSLDQKVLSAAAKVLYIAREENRAVQIDGSVDWRWITDGLYQRTKSSGSRSCSMTWASLEWKRPMTTRS